MTNGVKIRIKKLLAGVTLLSIEVVILLVAFVLALLVFILIARMVFEKDKTGFDVQVFSFLSGFESQEHTRLMQFFTFLGTHLFLIPANLVLIAWFLLLKNHRWYSVTIPVISASSLLLMFSLKFIFHRARPLTPLLQEARGYSFPSGHALMSFTFYGLLIYIVWQQVSNLWLRWLLIVVLSSLILSIGISRIYLRVHYASDVIAGFCLGLMWLLLSLWILKKLEKFSRKKIVPVVEAKESPPPKIY